VKSCSFMKTTNNYTTEVTRKMYDWKKKCFFLGGWKSFKSGCKISHKEYSAYWLAGWIQLQQQKKPRIFVCIMDSFAAGSTGCFCNLSCKLGWHGAGGLCKSPQRPWAAARRRSATNIQ
jgi:hypothetical protein